MGSVDLPACVPASAVREAARESLATLANLGVRRAMGGVKLKQTTATAASARVSLATVCRWDAFRAREAPKRVLVIVRSRVSVRARLRTGREARDCVCAAGGAVAASDVRNGKRARTLQKSEMLRETVWVFSLSFPEI